jgi:DDE family transposase
MFAEWLVEAYYLRMFLQLSHIPHYTTLQKFSSRINGTLLEKIISSFILLLSNIRRLFIGIDSTGFKITHASQYYTERIETRRKYAKLSIGADVLQQIICTIKIRRAPTRHDNIDFRPIITRTSEILPLSVVTGDKGYDSEENHVMVRELLHGFSIIPARYERVPKWRTYGRYRKQMKRGYSKILYDQRNKDETIISVIKRLFGEHVTSRLVRTQNRELSFRCIAYNTHRLTNLTIITWFLQSPFNLIANASAERMHPLAKTKRYIFNRLLLHASKIFLISDASSGSSSSRYIFGIFTFLLNFGVLHQYHSRLDKTLQPLCII